MISKKKLVDAPVAFRIAAIKSFKAESQNPITIGSKVKSEKSEAKLIIETAAVNSPSTVQEQQGGYSTSKLTALDKIRKQYRNNGSSSNGNTTHPLQTETLQKAWKDYIQILKKTKNSAVQSFERSELRIKDANSFEVVSTNNLEQKFIERERNKLFSFLQKQLENDLLQFNVIVEENSTEQVRPEISLTAREQFQKMSEQYPMVKELKDRLGLELDY